MVDDGLKPKLIGKNSIVNAKLKLELIDNKNILGIELKQKLLSKQYEVIS